MRIAFIGFGEAARAFRESLAARSPDLAFRAYDILLDRQGGGGPCAEAIRRHGVVPAFAATEAVADADWIVSAVTADQSLEAVKSVASALKRGQVLFDINSVSPGRKRMSAGLLEASGATYVDMAVMAPVHPRGHATPTLLAGPVDEALAGRLGELGFSFGIAGKEAGEATAIKMVRSLFVKGVEALTVETLLAAAASGCLDTILDSLGKSFPGLGLPDFAGYEFERTLTHGRRRAAEMRESARTLSDLGLHGRLADAVADVQEAMGTLGIENFDGKGFREALAELVRRRRDPEKAAAG